MPKDRAIRDVDLAWLMLMGGERSDQQSDKYACESHSCAAERDVYLTRRVRQDWGSTWRCCRGRVGCPEAR